MKGRCHVCTRTWTVVAADPMKAGKSLALILSAHRQGIKARQHDAWEIGMTTTDDFAQADVRLTLTA